MEGQRHLKHPLEGKMRFADCLKAVQKAKP